MAIANLLSTFNKAILTEWKWWIEILVWNKNNFVEWISECLAWSLNSNWVERRWKKSIWIAIYRNKSCTVYFPIMHARWPLLSPWTAKTTVATVSDRRVGIWWTKKVADNQIYCWNSRTIRIHWTDSRLWKNSSNYFAPVTWTCQSLCVLIS